MILLSENLYLFRQNNEITPCNLIKATIRGSARPLSYEGIVEAQKKRNRKEAGVEASRRQRNSKRY